MKQCKACYSFMDLSFFHNMSRSKDGKQSYCKKCISEKNKKYVDKDRQREKYKKWALKNKEKIKEYHKRYYNDNKEAYLLRDKENRQKASYKEWRKKYVNEYNRKNKEKINARDRARKLLKKGIIKRLPCQICGENKTEFHHPDYKKPFQVYHLCDFCHKEVHKNKITTENIVLYYYSK